LTTSPGLPPEESRAGARPKPTLSHRLLYGLYRGLTGLLGVFPERLAEAAATGLARLLYRIPDFRLKDTLAHLELAFPDNPPEWRRRVARASYEHLVREALQVLRLYGRGTAEIQRRTTVEGLEPIRRAIEEGRGALALTGHLGNWEIGAASVAARGIPVDVVAHRQTNPLFDRHWIQVRESVGIRTLVNYDAFRLVPRSLAEGRLVALVTDQNQRARGVFVPFFGRLASTARGPALFALRADVPIFLGAALREPGWPPRYRLRFRKIEVPETGDRREIVRELTRRHVTLLEERIRDAPEQYFWMHRRWKTRPEDMDSRRDPRMGDPPGEETGTSTDGARTRDTSGPSE